MEKVVVSVGLTLIELPVSPLLHSKLVAPLAVKTAVSPAQTVASFTETIGCGFTRTCVETCAETQPKLVPTTEKVVVSAGLTLIELPVSPLLHSKLSAPNAVKIAVWPAQIVVFCTETTGVGLTVTVAETGTELTPAVFPVTVKLVVAVGLTVIVLPVAPLLHS